ncbi:MAG: hypothetical protein IPM96_14120 [Ignavibacteria bacterium]|nr:hypothetical protein [Ignavibacteria bacterium]
MCRLRVIPDPDANQLSRHCNITSENFRKLTGIIPRVAFLSFSTKGSAKSDMLSKITEAVKLTKKRKPKLIDGELQFDAAFNKDVAGRKT